MLTKEYIIFEYNVHVWLLLEVLEFQNFTDNYKMNSKKVISWCKVRYLETH